MSEKIWTVAEAGQQKEGKHSTEEIAVMLAANPRGKYLVWKEGMGQWADPRLLSEFRPLGTDDTLASGPLPDPTPPSSDAGKKMKEGGKAFARGAAAHLGKIKNTDDSRGYLPHLNLVDALLEWVGRILSAKLLDTLDEWAKKVGHLALILSAVLLFVFDVLAGIKLGPFVSKTLMGLLIFPTVIVVQYLAYKFLDAGKAIIAKSPSNISTKAFFECIALLLLLGAVGAFFGGIFASIQTESLIPMGLGLGVTLILAYSLGVALNRSTVNIHVVADASAGQEAIGIISFFMKLELRIVPFIFGVVNILAPFALLYLMGVLLLKEYGGGAPFMKAQAQTYIIGVALLPFAAYLAFLIYYLLIDLIRSILVVPEKLDKLIERNGGD